MLLQILAVVAAYLLGAIPTALWVGKWIYGIDIRQHGSGNSGATNTFRVLGKRAGTGVMLFDIFKGWAAASLAHLLVSHGTIRPELLTEWLLGLGLVAVLGHIYPIYANFKGGKGVATLLGVALAAAPLAAVGCIVVFVVVLWSSLYVSLSSMTAALAFPLLIWALGPRVPVLIGFGVAVFALVVYTHRQNIGRLLSGTESRANLPGRRRPS